MLKNVIGKRIKELRIIKKDYSQAELANVIGCNRAYLSRIESGRQNVTIESLNQICNALDTTLSDFFCPFTSKIDTQVKQKE